jgi:hypothetical protein
MGWMICQKVLDRAVINADETEVRMLKPRHGKAITGCRSGYAGDADHPFVFYDFRPRRSRDGPAEVLAEYRVWPYLTDVLRRIAAIAPGDTAALESLLPDRWLADHPEHQLEQREEESREAQARRRRNGPLAALPPPNRRW